MKIILLKSWWGNIGDGFVQKGAKALLEKAFPGATLIEASVLGNDILSQTGTKWLYKCIGTRARGFVGEQFLELGRRKSMRDPRTVKIANVGELVDADAIVLAGCVLNSYLDMYLEAIRKIRRNGVPLILLGAGGGDYTAKTVKYVSGILDMLEPSVLVARDSETCARYSNRFEISFEGIDCAFFVNEYYSPPKADRPFVVATFDETAEPEIATSYPIIRPHHSSLELRFGIIRRLLSLRAMRDLVFFDNMNAFVSDNLDNYLFLYSNAAEVHSDRVHACVAALSYDTPARLYMDTPRAMLFERIVSRDITKELVTVDHYLLRKRKDEMLSFLRRSLQPANVNI